MSTAAGPSSHADLPRIRDLYFQLGCALLENHRHADAAQAFEQSLKEEGSNPDRGMILLNLAAAYEQSNERDLAFRNYLQVVLSAPDQLPEVLPRVDALLTKELAAAEGEWLRTHWEPAIP